MIQAITIISMLLLVLLDQVIKILVLNHLRPIGSLPLIDGVIQLQYAENTGAAFGSFSAHTDWLSVFTLVVIIIGVILLLTKKIKFGVEYVCTAAILTGGLGNLIDRLYRGFVVDYIEPLFIEFAIFNFADILVTCGAFVLVAWIIVDIIRESKREKTQNDE